jgi:hypothetical protein
MGKTKKTNRGMAKSCSRRLIRLAEGSKPGRILETWFSPYSPVECFQLLGSIFSL